MTDIQKLRNDFIEANLVVQSKHESLIDLYINLLNINRKMQMALEYIKAEHSPGEYVYRLAEWGLDDLVDSVVPWP